MRRIIKLSATVLGIAAILTGCNPTPKTSADVKFENGTRSETLNFMADADAQTVVIAVSGEWKTSGVPSWITLTPSNGKTSSIQNKTINVGVEANASEELRSASIVFTAGTRKATLTVTQNGNGMGDALYTEDCGPAVASNTNANEHTGYIRGGSLSQSGVTYASSQGTAIRNSSPATATGFSGPALVFLNGGANFQIKNINVTGNQNLILRFGAGVLEGTYGVDQALVNPSETTLKVEVGYDGEAWATVPFTANQVNNDWAWVSAPFAVAPSTTSIYVRISILTTAGGRVDDFSVLAGGSGALINPETPTTGDIIDPTALYYETFPTAVGANTALDGYTFNRGGTLDQAQVTYTATQGTPIRNSTPPTASTIGVNFSGTPILYLNSTQSLTIGKINVTGNANLTLKFAAGVKASSDASAAFMLPTSAEIKLEIGYNGTDYAVVPFTGSMVGANNWCLMAAPFKVAGGTTQIYVRFTALNTSNVGIRIDDFQLVAGGNGTEITPGGGGGGTDPTTKKTIAQLRSEYGSSSTGTAINTDYFLEGTVVSDLSANGKNVGNIALINLQDNTTANSGITVYGESGVDFSGYAAGTKVRVNLNNAKWTIYNDLIQLSGIKAADVTTTTNGTAITAPTVITVAQLKTGVYESMLVQINDVELIDKTAGVLSVTNSNIAVQVDAANQFTLRIATLATFKGEQRPLDKGALIGIAGVYSADYQISPRTYADMNGMQGAAGDFFNVTPSGAKPVGYAAGSFDISITSNVAWTATSSDNTNFPVSTNSGSNNGTVTVTYTENTSTTATRQATITLATTANVTTKTYTVNITQAATPQGGTPVDWKAGWDMTGIEWGDATMGATMNDSENNVTIGALTKVGFTVSGSSGANNWGGSDFAANTDVATSAKYAYFTVTSSKTFSLTSLLIRVRTTRTGPGATALAYQIDGGALTVVETWDQGLSTQPSGTANYGPYTFTLPATLANLAGGTVVTFRIVPLKSNWTTTGNWYISNNGFTGESLKLSGSYVE